MLSVLPMIKYNKMIKGEFLKGIFFLKERGGAREDQDFLGTFC